MKQSEVNIRDLLNITVRLNRSLIALSLVRDDGESRDDGDKLIALSLVRPVQRFGGDDSSILGWDKKACQLFTLGNLEAFQETRCTYRSLIHKNSIRGLLTRNILLGVFYNTLQMEFSKNHVRAFQL